VLVLRIEDGYTQIKYGASTSVLLTPDKLQGEIVKIESAVIRDLTERNNRQIAAEFIAAANAYTLENQ